MNTVNYHGLKFLYVRDPQCPAHVLTIARKLSDDKKSLIVTYCANKVVLSDVAYRQDAYVPKWIVLDRFNKKTARHVCVERFLQDKTLTVPLRENEKNFEAALDFFAMGGHRSWEKGNKDPVIPLTVMRLAGRALMQYESAGRPVYAKSKKTVYKTGDSDNSMTVTVETKVSATPRKLDL